MKSIRTHLSSSVDDCVGLGVIQLRLTRIRSVDGATSNSFRSCMLIFRKGVAIKLNLSRKMKAEPVRQGWLHNFLFSVCRNQQVTMATNEINRNPVSRRRWHSCVNIIWCHLHTTWYITALWVHIRRLWCQTRTGTFSAHIANGLRNTKKYICSL